MNPECSGFCVIFGDFATSHQSSESCSGSMEDRTGLLPKTVLGGIFENQPKLQLDQTKVWKYSFSSVEYALYY